MPDTMKLAYEGIRVHAGDVRTGRKAYKSLAMEGAIARRYARDTGADLAPFQALAARIAGRVPSGANILEVAPGPGYLSVELARSYKVTGLDISRSFVTIAADNASATGLEADFRHGDAAAMPLSDETFDFVVCSAAFKNFREPVLALLEIHRVLKPAGLALINDMRKDATNAAIEAQVRSMKLPWMSRLTTRWIFKYSLRPRAYSMESFRALVAATPFAGCDIEAEPLGFAAWLRKA